MPQVVAFAIAIGVLAASGAARTQDSPLKTNVAAASIEVDVRDARGNAVTGLTAADFVVTENREHRPVISVDYLAPRAIPRPAAIADAAPDVVTNRENDTAGAVLFVLDDSTPMSPGDGLRVAPLVSDAIRRVPDGERIGLFFSAARKFNVPFSQDRARLLAAARKFTAKADLGSVIKGFAVTSVPGGAAFGTLDDSAEALYRATLRAIREGAETLAMQPYRRKSLILFSAGLPLPPGDEPKGSSLARDLRAEYNTLIAAARQAGICINVVEPGGLRADFGSLQSSTFDAPAGGIGRLNREFLTSLARDTGGLAAVRTNEPAKVIDRMLNDAASFYLLRFGTDLTASAAVPAAIAVTTTRGVATIRPRRDPIGAPSKPPALGDALLRTTPGVPLDLAMIPVPAGPGRPAALIAVVQVRRSTGGTTVQRQHHFTLIVSAYAADGHPAASRRTRVNTVLPAGQEAITFEIVTRLDVAPGWYSVRAAIEADEEPKLGSVLGDVEVPRFGDAPMTMSGLAIAVSPPLMSQPKSALDGLRITTPTALRVFRPTERITAAALISINGRTAVAPVDVELQILTDQGRTVLKESRRLTASDFTGGVAEVTFPAALTKFEAGGYWISLRTLTADGKPLSRSSRFEIR